MAQITIDTDKIFEAVADNLARIYVSNGMVPDNLTVKEVFNKILLYLVGEDDRSITLNEETVTKAIVVKMVEESVSTIILENVIPGAKEIMLEKYKEEIDVPDEVIELLKHLFDDKD